MTALAAPDSGRLIDPELFVDTADGVRLAGSTCADCGTTTFPAQGSCPRCAGQNVARRALAADGSIWAFTIQRFTPKTPYLGAECPPAVYAVGYVDLGGDVLVESRLLAADVDAIVIGDRVTLTFEQLPGTAEEPVWTFAFAIASSVAPSAATASATSSSAAANQEES